MPASPRAPFEYALIRVVPRVERGECLNAGVMLFCRPRRFLGARIALDRARLQALAPYLDRETIEEIEAQLALIPRVCAGDPAAGPIALLTLSERWHWLSAPSSTIVQPSPVHTGLCDDPEAELDDLFRDLVLLPVLETAE
ncbi:MAG: hypothetical protein KatS3mg059_1477 [Thermomicrobiales bacterium]|nr:MAG: hypothetical protein KatS3mg059_1477 [Thermomicrobiales bacterium]